MTLRVLLAGLGVRGMHWAEVLHRSPRCEIAAYVDPNPAAVEHAADKYGDRPSFNNVGAALAAVRGIDALVLANPPIGREAQVQAAAARGIPMLIEKPLALSVREAVQLVELAGDVPLMVGLNFRYLAVTHAVMSLLADATVGQPEFARFTYERWRDGNRANLNKYPLTMDQPMLWEQSIHHFDLMRYVYGLEPVLVECQTWNPSWSMYASDANVAALFAFGRGSGASDLIVNYQGTWQSNWAQPNFEWRTECSAGIITQRDQFGALAYARRDDPALTDISLPPHELWITETEGLLNAFVDSVVHGAALQCSGRDHILSLAMVEACARSSRERRAVTIQSILDEGGFKSN
ncbi:Gfo/Idh/MocA family oxidoreductase [Anaerolineae bacterium CFX9]|nr:Gfo/Idh/MocA family oxidoreductase [Anaerolineae bacterium CFX9]